MIQITPQMRIFVAVEPVDFRKGIDGLAGMIRSLDFDPFSGGLFVFKSRSGSSLRVIAYDGQGFWLCQKRLSKGRFHFWPKADKRLHPLAAYDSRRFSGTRTPGRHTCGNP